MKRIMRVKRQERELKERLDKVGTLAKIEKTKLDEDTVEVSLKRQHRVQGFKEEEDTDEWVTESEEAELVEEDNA